MISAITPATSAVRRMLRTAIAAPVAGLIRSAKATSSSAPIIAPTPKPASTPLSELHDQIRQRNALPPHSRKRAPMLKAIYSDRHEILRRGPDQGSRP